MRIRSIFVRIMLIIGLMIPGIRTEATGIPVVDVANLTQNVQNVIYQYQKIVQMYRDYQLMVRQYEDLVENLKNINGRQLLLGMFEGRDARLGVSFLTSAQYLQPSGSQWRQNIETLLRQHYNLLDRNQARHLIGEAFNQGRGYDRAQQFYDSRDREMTPLLDAYHFQAAQEEAARRRQTQIDRIQNSFSNLADRSAVRQAQHQNSLLSMIAQQNETMIDSQHMMMSLLVQNQIQSRSDLDRAQEAEIRRLSRVRATPRYSCPNNQCVTRW